MAKIKWDEPTTPTTQSGLSASGFGSRFRNIPEPVEPESFSPLRELGRGVMAGGQQLQAISGGATALAAETFGLEGIRDWGLEVYQRNMQEAQEYAAKVGSYKDVESLGEGVEYISHGVGQLLPMFLPSLVTGGVGAFVAKRGAQKGIETFMKREIERGLAKKMTPKLAEQAAKARVNAIVAQRTTLGAALGSWAGSSATQGGMIYPEILNETGESAPGVAGAFALLTGALDAAPVFMALRRAGVGQEAINNVVEEAVKSGFFMQVGKQGAAEGATEMLQTVLEKAAIKTVDNNYEIFSPENREEIINAGILGAAGGAVLGGMGEALPKPRAPKPEDEKDVALLMEQAEADARAEVQLRGGDLLQQEMAAVAASLQFAEQARSGEADTARKVDLELQLREAFEYLTQNQREALRLTQEGLAQTPTPELQAEVGMRRDVVGTRETWAPALGQATMQTGIIPGALSASGATPTGSGTGMGTSTVVGRTSPPPTKPTRIQLQPRDRSTSESINQMTQIAARPDYARMAPGKTLGEGTPVVERTIDPGSALLGREDEAVGPDGKRYPVQYAVVSASSLLSSNRVDGTVIAEYETGVDGKARAIAGNGRVAGIQAAYERGTADKYRAELIADAATHGIQPAMIEAIDDPVLVRLVPPEQVTATMGLDSNRGGIMKGTGVERTRADAQRMDLERIRFTDDGRVTRESLIEFINSMPQEDRNALIDSTTGQPSKEAVDRLNNAIFERAYKDPALTNQQAEAATEDSRNVMAGLRMAAANVAKLNEAGGMDLRPYLVEAAQIAMTAARNGESMQAVLEQNDAFRSPQANAIAQIIAKNIRSAKKMGEALNQLALDAINEGQRPTEDMFGATPPKRTLDELLGLTPASAPTNEVTTPAPKNLDAQRAEKAAADKAAADKAAADKAAADKAAADKAAADKAAADKAAADKAAADKAAADKAAADKAAADKAAADKAAVDKAAADKAAEDKEKAAEETRVKNLKESKSLVDALRYTAKLSEVLEWVAAQESAGPLLRMLAKEFAPYLAEIPVVTDRDSPTAFRRKVKEVTGAEPYRGMEDHVKRARFNTSAQGMFAFHPRSFGPGTNVILINTYVIEAHYGANGTSAPGTIAQAEAEVVVHEALHALTSLMIDGIVPMTAKQQAALVRLKDLHKKIKRRVDADAVAGTLPAKLNARYRNNKKYYYGDVHEFLTFGLTDTDFSSYLRTIQLPNAQGNAWSQFVQMLRDLFNVPDSMNNAFLELAQITRDMAPEITAQIDVRNHSVGDNILAQEQESRNSAIRNGLNMSKAARMARAAEQGFDTLKVWYHGSPYSSIEAFDIHQTNYGLFGMGVYLTESADIASGYSNGRRRGADGASTVYPLLIKKNMKLMDMDAKADLDLWRKGEEAVPEDMRVEYTDGMTNEDAFRATEEYYIDQGYSREDGKYAMLEVVQGMGFDGITHLGGGRVKTDSTRHQVTIIFDPQNIRSVNAAFDPKDTDSVRILASRVDPERFPNFDADDMVTKFSKDVTQVIDKNPESAKAIHNKVVNTLTDTSIRSDGAFKKAMDFIRKSTAKDLYPNVLLRAIARAYLPDFVPEAPSVRAWVDEAKRMSATVAAYMNRYSPTVDDLENFNRANHETMRALAQLESESTIAGADPSAPYDSGRGQQYRSAYPALKRKWEALGKLPGGKEAQALFIKMRDAYKQTYDDTTNAIIARLDALEAAHKVEAAAAKAVGKPAPTRKGINSVEFRKILESQKLPDPYFPLHRFGKYWLSATKGKGKTADRIFARFETVEEMRDYAAELSKNTTGYEIQTGRVDGAGAFRDAMQQMDPALFTQIETILSGITNDDERTTLQDQIHQLMLQSLPEASMRKHMIHRKNREGYSLDIVRGFAKSMFHSAHQIGKLEHLTALQLHLKAAGREIDAAGGELAPNKFLGPMREVLQAQQEWALNPSGSAWANNLNRLGFVFYLGATPAAALLNMTQTVILGAPVIAARKGVGMVRASAALLSASNDHRIMAAKNMGRRVATKSVFLRDKYTYDELLTERVSKAKNLTEKKKLQEQLEAYRRLHAEGTLDRTQAHDIQGIADAGEQYTGSGYAISEKIGAMFHAAEVWNREVTAMAAFRIAQDDGLGYDGALQIAKDAVDMAHFDYTSANRPMVLHNDIGKVLFLFRQHSMNMTYRLLRDTQLTLRLLKGKGRAVDQNREAGKRLAGMLGMTMIFAGASGLPLYSTVKILAAGLLGDDDEKFDMDAEVRSLLAQAYGEQVATAIMKGPVNALTGADVASRVSLSNLWFREPLTDLDAENAFNHYLFELGGANLAMIAGPFRAAAQLSEGYERGWEQVMPKAIRDVMRTMRYMDEGLTNFRGDPLIPKEGFATSDLLFQVIGFGPEAVSTRYEQNRAVKRQEQFILNRRSGLLARYWMALQDGDQTEVAEVREQILKYNQANPEYPLTGKSITDSMKQRQRYSRDSLAGININENLRYLADRLKFTDL